MKFLRTLLPALALAFALCTPAAAQAPRTAPVAVSRDIGGSQSRLSNSPSTSSSSSLSRARKSWRTLITTLTCAFSLLIAAKSRAT